MPYIDSTDRSNIDKILKDIMKFEVSTMGQLNYIITRILHTYIEKNGSNYSNFNNIIGVLECVKLEYYRRIVSEYEELKIKENGDIY